MSDFTATIVEQHTVPASHMPARPALSSATVVISPAVELHEGLTNSFGNHLSSTSVTPLFTDLVKGRTVITVMTSSTAVDNPVQAVVDTLLRVLNDPAQATSVRALMRKLDGEDTVKR